MLNLLRLHFPAGPARTANVRDVWRRLLPCPLLQISGQSKMAARWSSENVVVEFRDSQVTGCSLNLAGHAPGGFERPGLVLGGKVWSLSFAARKRAWLPPAHHSVCRCCFWPRSSAFFSVLLKGRAVWLLCFYSPSFFLLGEWSTWLFPLSLYAPNNPVR